MSKKSEKKLAHHRLQMLEFAETLGNVSEACRKMGISRTQFYEYKQRYREQGLEQGNRVLAVEDCEQIVVVPPCA